MGLSIVGALAVLGVPGDPSLVRERTSFNGDWRFEKGDPQGIDLRYETLKPALLGKGEAPEGGPYAQAAFDDKAWRSVRLPHDWGIEGPFKQEYPGETGKLPWWGVGWYRKRFTVSAQDAGRRFYLDLDGAMAYASVWLNGRFVGGRPYGYSSFRVDLTPHLKAGGENVLAVRLDNPEESSRWYPGGGIYRNVWLVKTSPVAVDHWGVSITTPDVSAEEAAVEVKIDVANWTRLRRNVTVATELFEVSGNRRKRVAGTPEMPASLRASDRQRVYQQAVVKSPRLWSPSRPAMYVAVSKVMENGRVVDVVETPFGIRSIQFDAKQGFLLNGKRTYMKGVCLHHDLGALGAAFNLRAQERQLQIMKEMGVNAIRTSHNPPAPEFLDLCDRMGFLVIDEFSDTWTRAKKQNGYARLYADWHQIDLRGMIRRDRNHPSVVMWSTGNEVAEQENPSGHVISKHLTAIVHDEDPTRPVTTGNDRPQAGTNGFAKTVDVFGYNYKPRLYKQFLEANPGMPLYGSETASAISSRGEYFFPVSDDKSQGKADFQMSSYDLYAPGWAMPPDVEFKGQDENPSVFGEFVWTGFDYLGEPTPYNSDATVLLNYSDPAARAKAEAELKALGRIAVPSRSSYFGIVDLAGFPKDRFYIYQARWRPELRTAHLLPHWNWPERVGQVTPVHLYSSGDEAELFLNGVSQGRKKRGALEYRFRWDDVVYAPGELRAVVYKKGKPWAEDVVWTTGAAVGLALKADRARLQGADDLAFVTLAVVDAKGQTVPRSKQRVTFEIEGPGEIVATDNGDATDLEAFPSRSRKAYNGLALAIVRPVAGKKGAIRVRAVSDGLKGAEVVIQAR